MHSGGVGMIGRKKLTGLLALVLAAVLLLGGCASDALGASGGRRNRATEAPRTTAVPRDSEATPVPEPLAAAQALADYIFEHGELPENFLTKKAAQALGWDSRRNDVSDVAPGMSIGGDYFGNYERRLPVVKGRKYYEADCWYTGGNRNQYRIIWSTDGHVWYTEDHYETFVELFPTEPAEEERK